MMERALKERIIGAAVLVVFVVLVVPIFLDGPPEEGEIISERVLLPGQEEQKTQTVVLDRDRTEPVPAATAPQQPQEDDGKPAETTPPPDTGQAERQPPPVSQPAETAAPAPSGNAAPPVSVAPATSTTGMWAVQLGSFSNERNAVQLRDRLIARGYRAFVRPGTSATGAVTRVYVGPERAREDAVSALPRLEAETQLKGMVVRHPPGG